MNTNRARILVCDDEEVVREVVAAALDAGGYEAVCASGGVAALEAFEADADGFALAIVDRRMPDLDGLEVIARLRAARPRLPILLASGGHDAPAELQQLPGPPVALLPKPFRPSGLLSLVATQLAPA